MDLLTVLLIGAAVVVVYLVVKKAQNKDENVESTGVVTGKPTDDNLVQTSAKSAKAPKAKTSKK